MKQTLILFLFSFISIVSSAQVGFEVTNHIHLHQERQMILEIMESIDDNHVALVPSLEIVTEIGASNKDNIYYQIPRAYLLYNIWGEKDAFEFLDGTKNESIDEESILFAKAFISKYYESKHNQEYFTNELKKLNPDSPYLMEMVIDEQLRTIWSMLPDEFGKELDVVLKKEEEKQMRSFLMLSKAEWLHKEDKKEEAIELVMQVWEEMPETIDPVTFYIWNSNKVSPEDNREKWLDEAISMMNKPEVMHINLRLGRMSKQMTGDELDTAIAEYLTEIASYGEFENSVKYTIGSFVFKPSIRKKLDDEVVASMGFTKEQISILEIEESKITDLIACSMNEMGFKRQEDVDCESLVPMLEGMSEAEQLELGEYIKAMFSFSMAPLLGKEYLPRDEAKATQEIVSDPALFKAFLDENPMKDYQVFFFFYEMDVNLIPVLEELAQKYRGAKEFLDFRYMLIERLLGYDETIKTPQLYEQHISAFIDIAATCPELYNGYYYSLEDSVENCNCEKNINRKLDALIKEFPRNEMIKEMRGELFGK